MLDLLDFLVDVSIFFLLQRILLQQTDGVVFLFQQVYQHWLQHLQLHVQIHLMPAGHKQQIGESP